GLPSFRRNGKFSTWLYRITTNTALMRLRAGRYRRTETLDDVAEDVENESSQRSEELLARRQLADSIGNALNRLHPRYRQAFVLREVEERSVSEVAKILSLSHSATRQRVYRARLMLRGYLERLRDVASEPAGHKVEPPGQSPTVAVECSPHKSADSLFECYWCTVCFLHHADEEA